MSDDNRWDGWSDEQLEAVRLACAEALHNPHTDQDQDLIKSWQAVRRLAAEEMKQRSSGYRGPGIYRHHGGRTYEALGTAPAVGVVHVVLKTNTGEVFLERLVDFNGKMPGDRTRYERVKP